MNRVRRRLCIVGCVYGLLAWGYAVAMQLRNPFWVYFVLAWWLPIRLDYLGELGFAASLLFAVMLALDNDDERIVSRRK